MLRSNAENPVCRAEHRSCCRGGAKESKPLSSAGTCVKKPSPERHKTYDNSVVYDALGNISWDNK